MGLGIPRFGRGSATNTYETYVKPKAPEPDPKLFTVERVVRVNNAAVARIIYPGCTTYKGAKVLVYKNYDEFKALCVRSYLDPHFIEGQPSPVARFAPDKEGWELAIAVAQLLGE